MLDTANTKWEDNSFTRCELVAKGCWLDVISSLQKIRNDGIRQPLFIIISSWRQPLGGDGYEGWPPLSSVLYQSIAPPNVSAIDSMSSLLSIHRSLGLPIFRFLSNLVCSELCGIRSTVILSTCPNHRSLRWTTLSKSRVAWLPNACLMSSFPVFCSAVKPVWCSLANSFLL